MTRSVGEVERRGPEQKAKKEGLVNSQLVAIDVSAKELEVCIQRDPDHPVEPLRFDNHATGHQQLIRRLTKGRRCARIVLEATGVYSLDLALALHRAPRIEVMVVNPRAARDFGRAFLKRSKTDAIDAALLLEFVRRMEFRPWQPPSTTALELRAIARRCSALTCSCTQEKNRLHAARSASELPDVVRNDIEVNIRHIERRIARLEQLALRLVESDPTLCKALGHIMSAKGIALSSGLRILAELTALPPEMGVRQWVAHCGLDPRHHQSGSSVLRPTRISKVGNRYLRAALYMPAIVAIRVDPHVQAFYDKLVARGRKPLQAIVAVMRKLLHAIYGMLRHDADFDGSKFYDLRAENA